MGLGGGVHFYLLANKKFQVHSKTCSGTLVKQVALRVWVGGRGGRKHLKHFFSSKCVGLSNHLHMWGLPAAGDLEYFAGFTVAFKALPSRTVWLITHSGSTSSWSKRHHGTEGDDNRCMLHERTASFATYVHTQACTDNDVDTQTHMCMHMYAYTYRDLCACTHTNTRI